MKISSATNPHHRPPNLTSKWPQIEPKSFNLTFSNPKPHNLSLFLTHCTAKPDTNKNPTHENHSNPESLPSSRTQLPTSSQAFSPSSSLLKGLIFDSGPENSWDSLEIGSPVVKRYLGDEQERWYMWYHGSSFESPDSDSIGLAVSSNGIHWERGGQGVRSNADVGLVMGCSEDWWALDTRGVRPGEVVIMSSSKLRANSGVYWLYYTGFGSERIEGLGGDNKSLPGLAMSQDGRHWARIEGEHHSGALLDVGADGEWDSSFIASPHVAFHGPGDLRMYYHSFDIKNGHFAIGVARSRDGMRWVKLGKILCPGPNGAFDELGMVNPRVVRSKRDGGKYVMVYEGVSGDGTRSIGMAMSVDGLKGWRRMGNGPAFERSDVEGWDCEGVGFPCLVQMDGDVDEWRLYYRGIGRGGRSGIGLAISQGGEECEFERWSGFVL